MPPSRPESAASRGSVTLDKVSDSATVPRPPERVGVAKSPSSTQLERLQATIGYDQQHELWRPLARVGGFFTPPPVAWHRSLKTQQRAFTSRPRGLAGFGLRVARGSTSSPPTGGDIFELKLEGEKLAGLGWQTILHGEFDPGSGRTLAARLTHASRARTSPSGLGTAANG